MEDRNNYAETIAGLARASAATVQVDPFRSPVLVHHEDMRIKDMEEFMERPVRIRETQTVIDPVSFIQYFNRYASKDAILRVCDEAHYIDSHLDYHGACEPSHSTHKLCLRPTLTVHFAHWNTNSGKFMGQRQFAEFIEDHLGDIVKPDAADILDMIRTIRIIKGGSFLSEIDATAAGVKVDIASELRAKCGRDGLEIPSHIALRTQVWRFGDPVEVKARIRVRPDEGNLKICYEIVDTDALIEREFRAIANKVIDAVSDTAMVLEV